MQRLRNAVNSPACVLIATWLVLGALPFVLQSFQVFQLTLAMVYAVALLGLNMLIGYNGQISLGHGAFYAVGAYTAAILMDRYSVPYFVTIPLAGAVCLVGGYLFGKPALRLEGHYLALATFALGLATPQLLKWKMLEEYTGGVQGIVIVKPEPPFGLPLSQDQWLYLLALITASVLFLVARNLLRGRIGRLMIAIRDQPLAAQAMGIDIAFYKSMTFGISAMYTGIAGALGAIVVQFVSPDSFTTFLSISLVVGVVVGGLCSLSGAVFGALFIQFVPNIADEISKAAPGAIYGGILIASVFLAPTGIAGLGRLVSKRLGDWMGRKRVERAIESSQVG